MNLNIGPMKDKEDQFTSKYPTPIPSEAKRIGFSPILRVSLDVLRISLKIEAVIPETIRANRVTKLPKVYYKEGTTSKRTTKHVTI